jgi:CrcB protein
VIRPLLLVLVGGVVGSLLRWGLTDLAPHLGTTLAINVAGSYLLAVLVRTRPTDDWSRPLLGTGFCGGFTTMSALAVGTVASDAGTAVLYLAASLVLGVGAARLGLRG